MAGANRTSPGAVALLEALSSTPQRFELFGALRRLECAFRDRPRLGQSRRPSEDPVRLGQDPSVAFSSRAFAGLQHEKRAPAPRLQSRFLGLFGPHGPLPLHLTEYARDRLRNVGDATFARFADMFHHRVLSLFYRAFANSEPTISLDRPKSDRFGAYVASTFGAGLPEFLEGDDLPHRVRLYYAGRFAAQPRNAEGLAAIVGDYLRVPAEVEQFVAERVNVPPEAQWGLGGAGLGRDSVLGTRTWLGQSKFRVHVGPVSAERFDELLPGTRDFARLTAIIRSYAGEQLAWDMRLICSENNRPFTLGRASTKLGWTTTLGSRRDGEPSSIIVRPRVDTQGATTWERSAA